MKKLLLSILFIVLFISESLFVEIFSGNTFDSERIFAPHFLIIAIIFLAIFVGEKYGVFYGIIFGLFYDVVYTEILGVYLFLFPVIAYLVAIVMRFLHQHLVIASFITILGVSILEIVVYEINFLIRITEITFTQYLSTRLFPTVILNIAFLIIFSFPMKKYFEKFALQLKSE